MTSFHQMSLLVLTWCSILLSASAFRVPISDTDSLREVCSGMYGGKSAYIEVAFDPTSSGQVSLIIYEWKDVPYLGVETPDNSRTYICTTSAVRSGLCSSSALGTFITSLPSDIDANSTSIFTTPLKFSSSYFPTPTTDEDGTLTTTSSAVLETETGSVEVGQDDDYSDGEIEEETQAEAEAEAEGLSEVLGDGFSKRQIEDIVDTISNGVSSPTPDDDEDNIGPSTDTDETGGEQDDLPPPSSGSKPGSGPGGGKTIVPIYSAPITYAVPKTGYYCVGIVPVTLVNSRSDIPLESRQATHAEYSGLVLFKNTFEGELPAVEYPKINFYLLLSVVYFALGCGWAYLCVKHLRELLPMQYYISGTIVFLVIEMLAQFAYYRYINKHGGGTTSLVFLFVIAILNAARNSLSFFLLLIVSMGLSVVTQSLGPVMNKVRLLTAFHFIFGVMYSVGTVEVELDSASLMIVLVLIFPLALTLTAFLMWIIVSLNGTIMHLQARKQRYKLQMFQRLWRILILSVIAVAAFFVVSSMSLSNRLDENYAPNNWRYRWILLDGSLATIYLFAFAAIAYLWRPTRDNIRFSTSQELATDEAEADAEDYEIDALENGGRHHPLAQNDDDDDDEEHKAFVGEENVVFAMGDDSDDEDEEGNAAHGSRGRKGGYRDSDDGGSADEGKAGKND
ncbi:hypothetical protein IAR55_002027 [Kwoniella newhampshirensis]|uniref:Major facilitator protein n=1 Tax=Kwoniella newhampshirensis TaxID=1651941 RepID=A0AAW0Z0N5_9TREE